MLITPPPPQHRRDGRQGRRQATCQITSKIPRHLTAKVTGIPVRGESDSGVFSAIAEARAMGTVHQLPAAAVSITPQEAVRAYLATISHAESAGTKRVYGAALRR